jgi:threonyl-tRNA synthetase
VIVPISDRHLDHARGVAKRLASAGVRVETYAENEPMRVKIAKAQGQKVPYMLVVGDKEIETDTVSVRERTAGDTGAMAIDAFVSLVLSDQP